MKQASMTTLGITLLLGFTSPSYSSPDHKVTERVGTVHWIDLDGSKGVPIIMSIASNRTLTWTNPDGTQSIVERHSGPEPTPALQYPWANPDGYRNASMKAANGVDDRGPANAAIIRTDSAQYSPQLFHEAPQGDTSLHRFPLLGMLVAGVTLWLVRQLWPQ
jgi:hypothetical protein